MTQTSGTRGAALPASDPHSAAFGTTKLQARRAEILEAQRDAPNQECNCSNWYCQV